MRFEKLKPGDYKQQLFLFPSLRSVTVDSAHNRADLIKSSWNSRSVFHGKDACGVCVYFYVYCMCMGWPPRKIYMQGRLLNAHV